MLPSVLLALLLLFDLSTVKLEPNPEKRSDLALKNADAALTAARDAYAAGDDAKFKSGLDEVRASVDLSWESLDNSGKNPRNSSAYKRAEQTLGKLARRLDGLKQTASVVDQEPVEMLRVHVTEMRDRLLTAIMSKKK